MSGSLTWLHSLVKSLLTAMSQLHEASQPGKGELARFLKVGRPGKSSLLSYVISQIGQLRVDPLHSVCIDYFYGFNHD